MSTQVITGTHVSAEGVPLVGRAVTATPIPKQFVDGRTVDVVPLSTLTAAGGAWSLTMVQGVVYDVRIERWATHTIKVTSDAALDFSYYLDLSDNVSIPGPISQIALRAGAYTPGRQLEFDNTGRVVASDYAVGAAGSGDFSGVAVATTEPAGLVSYAQWLAGGRVGYWAWIDVSGGVVPAVTANIFSASGHGSAQAATAQVIRYASASISTAVAAGVAGPLVASVGGFVTATLGTAGATGSAQALTGSATRYVTAAIPSVGAAGSAGALVAVASSAGVVNATGSVSTAQGSGQGTALTASAVQYVVASIVPAGAIGGATSSTAAYVDRATASVGAAGGAGSAGALSATASAAGDTTAPTVAAFTIATRSPQYQTVDVSAFTGNDNVGVTGYLITETSTPPAAGAAGWSGAAPTTYTTTATSGTVTLYPWVKDAAGNVSAVFGSPRSFAAAIYNAHVTNFNDGTADGWGFSVGAGGDGAISSLPLIEMSSNGTKAVHWHLLAGYFSDDGGYYLDAALAAKTVSMPAGVVTFKYLISSGALVSDFKLVVNGTDFLFTPTVDGGWHTGSIDISSMGALSGAELQLCVFFAGPVSSATTADVWLDDILVPQ